MPRNAFTNPKAGKRDIFSRSLQSVNRSEKEPLRFQYRVRNSLQPTIATSLPSAGFALTSLDEDGEGMFSKTGKKCNAIHDVWEPQVENDDYP